MDTSILLAELTSRLPGHEIAVPGADESVASFRSAHPDIGDLRIVDDGDEYTVYIGDITHCHFGVNDELASIQAAQQQAAVDVVNYVEALLNDQIEFYGGGTYGGSRLRTDTSRSWLSRMLLGRKTYVWSGPL